MIDLYVSFRVADEIIGSDTIFEGAVEKKEHAATSCKEIAPQNRFVMCL